MALNPSSQFIGNIKTSPVALQGNDHYHDGESRKKRFTEQPECKNIFEDKFRKSSSNRDAILELLKIPNPLCVKHLQGVQEPSSSSICSHLSIPKKLNPENYQAKDQNIKRNTSKKGIGDLSETARTMKETESKEAAKRFNEEVQEIFSHMRTDFPSYVKEIPGTGGLHDISGIDSASESEIRKMTSFDSTESFISTQAKKRVLERWRKSQRYEHARAGGKGSTLSEVLCTPEEKMKNLIAARARRDSPFGISRADTRNVKLNAEHEYHTDDKLLMSKEDGYRCQSEVPGSFAEKEDINSTTSRSSKRKSQSRHIHASNSYALLNHISRDEIDLVKKDSLEEKPAVPPTPTATSTIGTGASTTLEYISASSVSSDACYPDFSRSMLKRCDSSRGAQEHSSPKLLGAEAGSSGSSKHAGPSPIFVLEVPSKEDVSLGPECLKQVSADLHALSLLSRESKSKFDARTHIKTDLAGEGSSLALDAIELVVSECWESFYIAEVLTECGLYDMDTDTFMSSSNDPNYPLWPWVFHNLERKYCDGTSAPLYKRMLLFDRVRSAVLEISQSCMNQCPWMKPVTPEFGLMWPKCKLRNELQKLLAIQDAEVVELISGKVTYWGDLRNSVDMICKIIEKSLTNDLLVELVTDCNLMCSHKVGVYIDNRNSVIINAGQ